MLNVLPDFREEGWHSMDLCSDMLVKNAPTGSDVRSSIPRYQNAMGFLPWKRFRNFERWYNRWKVYPRHLKQLATQSGFFHIVDHSYAHLANYLPEGRVGVYCHDLDAFRCIFFPDKEIRPLWFRRMINQVLEGFKKARIVFCSTHITRHQLLELGFWNAESIHVVPYGVATEFTSEGEKEPGEYILHVGSCIARKRVDVLIDAYAQVLKQVANLKLVQAGGSFSKEQKEQIVRLNLNNKVEQRGNLTRDELARLYRGAKCLVITSDAEGFGLPVIEGLSCGSQVVASDIPALREVGGKDVSYFPVGDSLSCADSVLKRLEKPIILRKGLSQGWSWSTHAKEIYKAYDSLSKL